jgi:hypothetical protein
MTKKERDIVKNTLMVNKNITDIPVIYTLWYKPEDTMVASALITHDGHGRAILWIIEVKQNERRKGYGLELLKQICSRYRVIETQWISEEGKALCLKAGFNLIDDVLLVWVNKN